MKQQSFLRVVFALWAFLSLCGAQTVTTTPASSTGGNGSADANKLVKFGSAGSIRGESLLSDSTLNVGGGTGGTLSGNPAITLTGSVSATAHGFSDERTYVCGTTESYNPIDIICRVQGRTSGVASVHLAGGQFRPRQTSGTLTNMYGWAFMPEFDGAGTTTASLRNLFIMGPELTNGATVTTVYGLQIGDLKQSGVTYGVGIAQEHASTINWIVGNTSFGYGSVPPTDAQVYVYPDIANEAAIRVANYSLTGSSTLPMLDLAGTWNTSGAATGIKLNITNTASSTSSKLLDLQASGTSKFAVGINGITGTGAAAPTIASAGTIAPVTPIVFVSGTTTVSTITAPAPISSGGGQITIIPTGLWATNTAGNIALGTTAVVNKALTMTYDVTTAKWYPSY